MLFQEKISKEFLENQNRREAPILEADESLKMLLYSIYLQTTKPNEVIIVDSGSSKNIKKNSKSQQSFHCQ